MTDIIDEQVCFFNSNNIDSFYEKVSQIVNYLEPSLETDEIGEIINTRDKLGDGLVNTNSLIIHVISKKVVNNTAVYCYLRSSILWQSKITNLSANIRRVVILIVNPNLKNGRLLNLENFINNKELNDMKRLVMG